MRWLIVCAMVVSAMRALAAPMKIGVYESETNAAQYHGSYQSPLRDWLRKTGYDFEVIGDAVASDPAKLGQFAAVVTSSDYIVPDAACAGFRQYVTDGGQLIWIDGPARCTNPDLLATLGIAPEYSYSTLESAQVKVDAPGHPLCAGVGDARTRLIGNPALKATGKVLASCSGKDAQGKDRAFPLVVATRTGKGRAVLLNWIIWLTPGELGSTLLGNALDFCLAGKALAEEPLCLRVSAPPAEVTQPAPVAMVAKVFGRPEYAGKTTTITARLVDAAGKTCGVPVTRPLKLAAVEGDDLAFASEGVSIPTDRLPDGVYTVAVKAESGGAALPEVRATVRLNAQVLKRLTAQQAARHKLLRPAFKGILGDYDAEPRTKEGRVDLPRLFQQIEAAHMNMYDFLIWHANTDWEDFQEFAKQAHERGLKVWITLAPPSEPPPSAPFGLDYLKWADEIGKLSEKYDNTIGLVIDDFWSGENQSLFTPGYIAQFAETLHRHNPKLAFLPTVYWDTIGDAAFIKSFGARMDGIVFPYADLESTQDLPKQLAACRKWMGPDKLLLINVYASGSSGTGEKGPRSAEYMRSILTISREMCDGIRIYCLPKEDFTDPRFAITAELYGQWSKEK